MSHTPANQAPSSSPQIDLIRDERDFLHTIATPLATLHLLIENMIETSTLSAQDLATVKKLLTIVGKVSDGVRGRREILIQRAAASSSKTESY